MENLGHNPLEQRRIPPPEMPTFRKKIEKDDEETIEDAVLETEQKDLDLAHQYDLLSKTSQDLYHTFKVLMAESTRSGGGAVQDVLLRMSVKQSLPEDFKEMIRKNYMMDVPETAGTNKSIFSTTLSEEHRNLRFKQIHDEIHNTNRIHSTDKTKSKPTLKLFWETLKQTFLKK